MIPISIIWLLLTRHLIGDFFLQSRWMAENKSRDNVALSLHVLLYSLVIMPMPFVSPLYLYARSDDAVGWWWLFNIAAHLLIDFVTSRISSSFYRRNKMREFWWTIGVDQYLHLNCLFISLALIAK